PVVGLTVMPEFTIELYETVGLTDFDVKVRGFTTPPRPQLVITIIAKDKCT
ncbi:hypothetical protein L9F63_003093, partial [Diploptera punctata]